MHNFVLVDRNTSINGNVMWRGVPFYSAVLAVRFWFVFLLGDCLGAVSWYAACD